MDFTIATLDTPWTVPGKIRLLLEARNDSNRPLPASDVILGATALWDDQVLATVPGLDAGEEWSDVVTVQTQRNAKLRDAPASLTVRVGGDEHYFQLHAAMLSGSLRGLRPTAKKEPCSLGRRARGGRDGARGDPP